MKNEQKTRAYQRETLPARNIQKWQVPLSLSLPPSSCQREESLVCTDSLSASCRREIKDAYSSLRAFELGIQFMRRRFMCVGDPKTVSFPERSVFSGSDRRQLKSFSDPRLSAGASLLCPLGGLATCFQGQSRFKEELG